MRQLREPIDSYRSPCTRPPRTTRIDRHTSYETPGSFWLGDAEIDDKKSAGIDESRERTVSAIFVT